jgi:hypothetical protein
MKPEPLVCVVHLWLQPPLYLLLYVPIPFSLPQTYLNFRSHVCLSSEAIQRKCSRNPGLDMTRTQAGLCWVRRPSLGN